MHSARVLLLQLGLLALIGNRPVVAADGAVASRHWIFAHINANNASVPAEKVASRAEFVAALTKAGWDQDPLRNVAIDWAKELVIVYSPIYGERDVLFDGVARQGDTLKIRYHWSAPPAPDPPQQGGSSASFGSHRPPENVLVVSVLWADAGKIKRFEFEQQSSRSTTR